MHIKESLKYLAGSVTIYMLAAACSEDGPSPLRTILDAGRDVVASSLDGRVFDGASHRDGNSGDGRVADGANHQDGNTRDGRAFDGASHRDGNARDGRDVDASGRRDARVIGPVRDAKAQDASNPVCACNNPSTSAANAIGGYIPQGTQGAQEGGVGPLFVTDALVYNTSASGGAVFSAVDAASSCASPTGSSIILLVPTPLTGPPLHSLNGARYLVPQGKRLCVTPQAATVMISWAGFRV